MHFRLTFDVPFLAIMVESPNLRFTVPFGQDEAVVEIVRKEDKKSRRSWDCIASCPHNPGGKVTQIFEQLHEGTLDANVAWEKYGLRGDYEFLGPPAYREVVDTIRGRLADLAARCVSLIQWRMELQGSHQPLCGGQLLYWSLDGIDWHPVPAKPGYCGTLYRAPYINDQEHTQITRLLRDGKGEPLGHELLREAMQLRDGGNERSAFVVAVMAAEVGVKQCIMEMLPTTEHLLRDVQSQPLKNLLEGLLPLIPAKNLIGGKVRLPAGLLDTINSATRIRNDLIHKGHHDKYAERLGEVIQVVRCLLSLLDFYRGYSWAGYSMRYDIEKELKSATVDTASAS